MLLFSALLLAYGGLANGNADLVASLEAAYQDRGVVSSKTVAIADLAAPLHYLDAGGSISKLVEPAMPDESACEKPSAKGPMGAFLRNAPRRDPPKLRACQRE